VWPAMYTRPGNEGASGMQAAFVDIGLEKSAFLYVGDVFDSSSEYTPMMDDEGLELEVESKRKRSHATQIEDLLQEGQEILVQVSKEPISTKGARVTTYISIPGRYLVMMPGVNHIGVSRRIEKVEERKRLREIVSRIRKRTRDISSGPPARAGARMILSLTSNFFPVSGKPSRRERTRLRPRRSCTTNSTSFFV